MSDIRILKGYGFEELSKKKIENARIGEAISEAVNPGELKRALLDVLDEEHSKAFAFYKSLNSDKEIVACFITGAVDINEVVPKGGQIIDLNKITGVDDDVLENDVTENDEGKKSVSDDEKHHVDEKHHNDEKHHVNEKTLHNCNEKAKCLKINKEYIAKDIAGNEGIVKEMRNSVFTYLKSQALSSNIQYVDSGEDILLEKETNKYGKNAIPAAVIVLMFFALVGAIFNSFPIGVLIGLLIAVFTSSIMMSDGQNFKVLLKKEINN